MKKIIASLILVFALLPMFAFNKESLEVYSKLIKFVEMTDTFAASSFDKQIPARNIPVYDYSIHPDSNRYMVYGRTTREFNMDFGVYYLKVQRAYLLIHHKSMFLYRCGARKLMQHIIDIKEKEPALVPDQTFLNIVSNIYVYGVDVDIVEDIRKPDVYNIDGMTVYYRKKD